MICFIVYGKIKGKARPRFGGGHVYTPRSTKEAENEIALAYKREKYPSKMKGALRLIIMAEFEMPKSWSKEKKQAMDGCPADKKPDADNIGKLVLDALKGLAYTDDRQITVLTVVKSWTKYEERLHISILEDHK